LSAEESSNARAWKSIVMDSGEKQEFRMIEDQTSWPFVNGRWRDGEILPPDIFLKGILDQGRDYEKRVLDLKWRFKTACGEKTETSRWLSEIRTRNSQSKRLQNHAWIRLAAHLDNLGALLEPSGRR